MKATVSAVRLSLLRVFDTYYRYSFYGTDDFLNVESNHLNVKHSYRILDTLQLIFWTEALYYLCVTNFFNPTALEYSPWCVPASSYPLLSAHADKSSRSFLVTLTIRL